MSSGAHVVSIHNMHVGRKGGGKHWTRKEVESRKKAAESMKRANVRMNPPAWVKKDQRTYDIWKRTIKKLKGLEILDDLDSDILSIYCSSVVSHEEEIEKEIPDSDQLQRWSKLILTLAGKLGLTPESRARLAKKKAEEVKDKNADLFD